MYKYLTCSLQMACFLASRITILQNSRTEIWSSGFIKEFCDFNLLGLLYHTAMHRNAYQQM